MRQNLESHLKAEILRVIGARADVRLFSTPTGQAFTRDGYPIKFGAKGMADICGIWRREIGRDTWEHARATQGTVIAPHRITAGLFLAIECKSPTGTQRPEQRAFQQMVERFGGVYILARTLSDVTDVLDGKL